MSYTYGFVVFFLADLCTATNAPQGGTYTGKRRKRGRGHASFIMQSIVVEQMLLWENVCGQNIDHEFRFFV